MAVFRAYALGHLVLGWHVLRLHDAACYANTEEGNLSAGIRRKQTAHMKCAFPMCSTILIEQIVHIRAVTRPDQPIRLRLITPAAHSERDKTHSKPKLGKRLCRNPDYSMTDILCKSRGDTARIRPTKHNFTVMEMK